MDNEQKQIFLDTVRCMLSGKRFRHSLRCANCAVELAELYKADQDKAWLAGLTHDVSRGQDQNIIKEWALLDKGFLTDYEKKYFNVLHSYASAWYLRNELKVDDDAILNAVRFHTTGSPCMDDLAKVVFVADYLEPGREHMKKQDLDLLLTLPLDRLVLTVLEATRHYLDKENIPLAPESRELYQKLTTR